jgi:hypothetical protein
MKDDGKTTKVPEVNLRTRGGMNDALQWVFEKQRDGQIDAKSADALNTTIKTAMELNVKLPLKAADIFFKSKLKKIEIPAGFLPAAE